MKFRNSLYRHILDFILSCFVAQKYLSTWIRSSC